MNFGIERSMIFFKIISSIEAGTLHRLMFLDIIVRIIENPWEMFL